MPDAGCWMLDLRNAGIQNAGMQKCRNVWESTEFLQNPVAYLVFFSLIE